MIFKRNNLLLVLTFVLISSCLKTITLQNERTPVPAKSDVYKNKTKFEKSLLRVVDTNVIYEFFNQSYNVLQRLDTNIETRTYGVYRFYPDGALNFFSLNRDKPLDSIYFNPKYNGYRGVYYLENKKIRYDLFAEINGWGWIGRLSGTLTFIGDTLYVKRDYSTMYIDIYIKRKLPDGYLDYKADW